MLFVDLRYAIRSLFRTPSFTMLAIGTLALGIGACTAIFSALYRLQFAPLPFATADRLVNLARTRPDEGFFISPPPNVVRAWQEHASTLEHVAMIVHEQVTVTGAGEPVELNGARVSPQIIDMVGVAPLLGRMLTIQDASEDAPVVVISEELWRTRFGADPAVLGRSVGVAGRPRTIVGVMPAKFARYADPYPRQQVWMPHVPRETDFAHALGLMREDVTPEQVSAELARIAAGVEEATGSSRAFEYRAMPLTELLAFGSRNVLPMLLGAVGLVLLVACANVASLMIVRLNVRRRELAIRATLGAGTRRIMAGIAAEQLLLALGAAVVGLLLAVWTMDLIARFQPTGMPLLDTLSLDPAVLAFAAALVFVSIALSGLTPAWLALRRDPADALRAGGERVTSGARLRSALVTGQIGLSVILLVGATLLIRNYAALLARDLGFDARNALAVEIALPEDRYTPEQRQQFFSDLLAGITPAPGLAEAAIGGGVPPGIGLVFITLTVLDSDASTEGIDYVTGTGATPGFLPVLGVEFIEGGDFRAEHADANAVIVNRSFAQRFWPGRSAVGRRFRITADPSAPWTEVIGVIEDVRVSHGDPGGLQVFFPQQWDYPSQTLLLRTDVGDPIALLPQVRQVVRRLDPDVALREAATLQQLLSDSLSRQRFAMLLLGVFAGLAFLLTIVGLYGLVSYTVQQRTREIGIRVALGATAARVRELFIAHGMRLVALGLLLGLCGAAAAVRVLRALVHGVDVYDGASFVAAIMIIAPAALLASWLPARRAARVDPMVSLKLE